MRIKKNIRKTYFLNILGNKFYINFKGKNRDIVCLEPELEKDIAGRPNPYYMQMIMGYMHKEGFLTDGLPINFRHIEEMEQEEE